MAPDPYPHDRASRARGAPLDPAVAAVRLAVRKVLDETAPGALVLAAVSGGPDSLALLAALAWEAPRAGRRSGAVHVDHGLYAGSAAQADRVVEQAKELEADLVEVVTAAVPGTSETASREARYAALEEVADRTGAELVLTGHTRDDQAESVLLGLLRGSGARSLAGIPPRRGRYARPLLDLPRATTEQACRALRLEPWHDPANDDPAVPRNRIRHEVLPQLGPGAVEGLARTAALLRADADLLDELAAGVASLEVRDLAALPEALRTRVLRRAAVEAGSPPGLLGSVHVRAMDELVTGWHGQGPVGLPGGFTCARRDGRLVIA